VENEDGEVVKKYDLPTQKPQPDLVSQGLKYIGMGVFAKAVDKSAAGASVAGEGPSTGGESSAPRQRKKSVVAAEEEEDDRHIRFTIAGVGKRMTKEDFIREVQKLDKTTRRELVNHPDAPQGLTALAALNVLAERGETQGQSGGAGSGRKDHAPAGAGPVSQTDGSGSQQASRSSSPGTKKPTAAAAAETPSSEAPETEVERRRRLAALKGVVGGGGGYDEDEPAETAAERRRREAALGMAPHGDGEEDSDDDDTPRVPPSRRSIRFADAPERGRSRE
jgi:hypothetical protein